MANCSAPLLPGLAMNLDDAAKQLLLDYDSKKIGTIFNYKQFSISQAYAMQSKVASLREKRGEDIIGYKVGCVSPALREPMGIFHPVFGRLFANEQWQSGVQLNPNQFSNPAIEGELAVCLQTELTPSNVSEQTIAAAIGSVFVVIEMHNKVFRGTPGAPELIANNALHAGVIRTAASAARVPNAPGPLQVSINGIQVASVSGVDLSTTIFESLRWLVEALQAQDHMLHAGQTVLCGTISGMHLIDTGASVEVNTDDFGSVTMQFG